MFLKKQGFTLAEVLVTLGIIGVVSAMTIPALTQNWQRRAYVTQLHKVYNEFQQVFTNMINENQAIDLQEAGYRDYYDSSSDYNKQFMLEHFKVVKHCGDDSSAICFARNYRAINGGSAWVGRGTSTVVIAGGAAITIHDSTIYVDVNGAKGPNIVGRDYFVMNFYRDGSIDIVPPECVKSNTNCWYGSNAKDARETYFNRSCKGGDGYACFGKLLNDNWEMNY